MKIYYRGYVINQEHPDARCTVQGRRPQREMLALSNDPQGAMRWVDRDVIRQRVRDAGWLDSRAMSA